MVSLKKFIDKIKGRMPKRKDPVLIVQKDLIYIENPDGTKTYLENVNPGEAVTNFLMGKYTDNNKTGHAPKPVEPFHGDFI